MIDTQDVIRELKQATSDDTEAVLKRLLIKSLAPLPAQVYDILLSLSPDYASSKEIAQLLGKKLNHTGNILKHLHSLGLLKKRYENIDGSVQSFYKAKK